MIKVWFLKGPFPEPNCTGIEVILEMKAETFMFSIMTY